MKCLYNQIQILLDLLWSVTFSAEVSFRCWFQIFLKMTSSTPEHADNSGRISRISDPDSKLNPGIWICVACKDATKMKMIKYFIFSSLFQLEILFLCNLDTPTRKITFIYKWYFSMLSWKLGNQRWILSFYTEAVL